MIWPVDGPPAGPCHPAAFETLRLPARAGDGAGDGLVRPAGFEPATRCLEDRQPVLTRLPVRSSTGIATCRLVAVRYPGWLSDRARNGHGLATKLRVRGSLAVVQGRSCPRPRRTVGGEKAGRPEPYKRGTGARAPRVDSSLGARRPPSLLPSA